MGNKSGINNNKLKKQDNYRKYGGKAARESLQYYVSKDVRRKNAIGKHSYNNEEDKKKGIEWFNNGLSLEDASEDMRNNVSFVAGFNRAYRIKLVNDSLYNLGREYFDRGISLDNVPENYRNNEFFIAGYNSCITINKHR